MQRVDLTAKRGFNSRPAPPLPILGMAGPDSVHPESLPAIAERLRRTREAMGFSNQAQWCRLVGIEPQAWNNYEQGRNRISVEQALKVCAATGITTDWIYRGLMSTGLPMNMQIALQKQNNHKNNNHKKR